MPARSNGTYLPLRPAVPLPGSGWTVQVYAHSDLTAIAAGKAVKPIATISRFVSLTLSPEISDVGAGSITLSLTDPIFSRLLDNGQVPAAIDYFQNLFVVLEHGQYRGEFLGQSLQVDTTGTGEYAAQQIVISGPGSAQVLAWGTVMSPYYPKTTPLRTVGVFSFTNQPVMSAWLTLLQACQKRGTITMVRPAFTAARDSARTVWEDTPKPKPKNAGKAMLAGDVAFAAGTVTTLSAAGHAACVALAKKLAKITYPVITVTGHTDSTGSRAANLQLSLDRANSVANAILAEHPLAQLTVVGKGETQPVASNNTAAGRRKNRRIVVTYNTDSGYLDTVYKPEKGTNLLDLLRQLTSGQVTAENRGPIHCEWIMQRGFRLRVQSLIGADRSTQVVFHEGSTWLTAAGRTYDRENIANLIAVENDLTVYKVASSKPSKKRWLQREGYTYLEGTYTPAIQAQIAGTQLQASGQQDVTSTVSIQPGPGRTPWVDFGLGDWIGLVRQVPGRITAINPQRVLAISVTVDAGGNAAYELTVEGKRASRGKWLQAQIDSLINRKRGVRAFVQDDEPTGGRTGDLWIPTAAPGVTG